MATKNIKPSVLRSPPFNNKKLFVAFFVVMAALTVDISIGTTQDVVRDFAFSPWGIALFVAIGAVYVAGQYFILNMVKAKTKESETKKTRNLDRLQKIIAVFQYILAGIMIFAVLQVIVASQYYTDLLTAAQTISYGLAIFLMSLLAYRFFSWFGLAKTPIVLLYGLFAVVYVVNNIATVILFDTLLLDKPAIVSEESEVIYQGNFEQDNPLFIVSTIQAITLNGYFALLWGGTVLLLRHNIQRLGRVKFWALMVPPLLFFMGFYVTFYQTINPASPMDESPAFFLGMILLIVYSAMAAVILFGVGFFSIARSLRRENHIRDYMLIAAYGIVILLVSSGATIGQAGYPPFGLANVLFVGPSAFLLVTGLYRSAISISEDVKLRQMVRSSIKSESDHLLDSIGTAEMQQEIEKRVMSVAKANADQLAQQSGVGSSITDEELKDYLHQATNELREKRASAA